MLLPTRDRPDKLRRALTSLLNQHADDWEAVVIDDGDGCGSRTAISLGDTRIRTELNPGRGQVDARNAAIGIARGELICWLDDDDWWDDPRHLDLLQHEAERGSFYFRGGWIVFDDGISKEPRREVFDLDATPSSLRHDNTVLTSSIAYFRSVHDVLGLLDAAMGSYWDWDLLLRMCAVGDRPTKLDGLGVCYEVHGENMSLQLGSPTRKAMFEKLVAKHDLVTRMKNHVVIHADHSRNLG